MESIIITQLLKKLSEVPSNVTQKKVYTYNQIIRIELRSADDLLQIYKIIM